MCVLQVTRTLLHDFCFYLLKTLRELCDEPLAVFPNITRFSDNYGPPIIMTTKMYKSVIILTYTLHIARISWICFDFKGGHKFYNISGIPSLLWTV